MKDGLEGVVGRSGKRTRRHGIKENDGEKKGRGFNHQDDFEAGGKETGVWTCRIKQVR